MKKSAAILSFIVLTSFAGCGDDAADPAAELKTGPVQQEQTLDAEDAVSSDGVQTKISSRQHALETEADNKTVSSGAADRTTALNQTEEEAVPSVPTGLNIGDYGSTSVILRWNAVQDAGGYNIYRAAALAGTYEKVNGETITGTEYADSGLAEDTRYFYKVSAVNPSGESAQSASVAQKTANPVMAYVRFCNFGSAGIAGMRLGRSWFRPVNIGELTSYVEALPGLYFFEYWNTETFEWEAVSTGTFTLQAGRRYTVRDSDASVHLNTDDVLKKEDAAVFVESMSSSKTALSPAYLAK